MEETKEHKFHLFTSLLAEAAQSFLTVPRTLRLVFFSWAHSRRTLGQKSTWPVHSDLIQTFTQGSQTGAQVLKGLQILILNAPANCHSIDDRVLPLYVRVSLRCSCFKLRQDKNQN